MSARDLRHLAVDAVKLGGAAAVQVLAMAGHAILDRLYPLDNSQAEAHRRALVDVEAETEVFEPQTESAWLGNGRPAASAGSGIRPGAVSDVPPSPAPGHSTTTSDLLRDAAYELRLADVREKRRARVDELIPELRARARLLANQDD